MSGLSRRKILNAIGESNNAALMAFGERLMKGEFELDEAPEKSCITCAHGPRAGQPSSLCPICKDHNQWWGGVVKSDHVSLKDPVKVLLDIASLKGRVRVLEDQHRNTPKVTPICPKPCYCQHPGQLPAVCLTFCASVECVYHREHKG